MLTATSGHGHVVKRPTKPAVGTMLANLRRGNEHLILERWEEGREGDSYIQVWLRENNTYQLEYRDGVPAEHYRTLTVSQEKVLHALLGWMLGKPGWREGFTWNNIGHMLDRGGRATALVSPERLWSAPEVLVRQSPVPAAAGVYGWHFLEPPHQDLDAGRLLYVGIAPRYMANRTSTQNLRKRVRYHFRGNAAGSTLRFTLGCLLGLELRRVGSGKRMTFGRTGEAALSQWMAENARVCWIEEGQPWELESQLISRLDLPLNLDQNRHNAFHGRLKELRAQARQRARELPVGS